jgi:(p)ppGpp synthase/HD superfamily hydrolase
MTPTSVHEPIKSLAYKKTLPWIRIHMPFLAGAENRETFFARIAELFPPTDFRYLEIERAYNYMKDGFRGKLREGGERYFEHIRANVLILIDYLRVKDYRLIIAEIMHDSDEDLASWTIERIRREFGEYVARLVDYMSKPLKDGSGASAKQKQDRIYHRRFEQAPREFFMLKLPDRLHNLLTLDSCSKEKQVRKIAETREHYLPYAERELILLHEMEEVIAILESN